MGLRAIPTRYHGTLFRSRAEARWAIAFDELGIKWIYEPEGYQLKTHWYLPDFWLPRMQCFAEVKGVASQWNEIALTKARELYEQSHCPVLMLTDIIEMDQAMPWVAFIPGNDVGPEYIDLMSSENKERPFYQWDDPKLSLWSYRRDFTEAQLVCANYFNTSCW